MSQELTDNLDRLLPTSLQQADTDKVLEAYLAFLYGATKSEHEEILELLPDRPIFQSLSTDYDYTSAGAISPRQNLTDILAYHTVIGFIRHVIPYEIIAHILQRIKYVPGLGIRRLTSRLSRLIREGLFDELIRLDDESKERYGILEEFEKILEAQFGSIRPGYLDYALSVLIANGENDKKTTPKARFELHALKRIRSKRRNDPQRLPQIRTAADARFVVEEVGRVLFIYPEKDFKRAVELLVKVDAWYIDSKMRDAILGKAIYMEIMSFFGELRDTSRALTAGWRFEVRWHTFIEPFLTSERFWHNLAGLNKDVPLMQTEAGVRDVLYRRSAVVGPVILMAPIVAPVVIMIAIRVPGAALRLVRWIGAQMLLFTQYAYATYRVYGLVAGTGVMARDAYVFYLTHPVEVNQVLTSGVEAVLDLFDMGMGLSPGSSPGDAVATATQNLGKMASKGISTIAAEVKTIAKGEAEIELIEFAATTADGKLAKVTAEVIGTEGGKVRVVVKNIEPVLEDFDKARKQIIFLTKPVEGEAAVVQDAKALGKVSLPSPAAAISAESKLLESPAMTKIAGNKVKSWHPTALVGTGEGQMRRGALNIIKAKGDKPHPLARILVDGELRNGGNMAFWEKDARFLQAAHVRSKGDGGADIIVLMSAYHNQRLSHDMEQAGKGGSVILDEVFDIGGVAMHKQTARDLVKQGWLDAEALAEAKVIDLRSIDFIAEDAAKAAGAGGKVTQNSAKASRGVGDAERMTGKAPKVKPPSLGPVGGGGLLDTPAFTNIAGRKVKSWNPDVLIGTSRDQLGDAALAIIKAPRDKPHPLAKVLVDGQFMNGGNKAKWAADVRYLEGGHVRSSKLGGPDIVVLMRTKYNRAFSANLEQRGSVGGMALDQVLDIGGIGVHRLTALDLVEKGLLDADVVKNAKVIDLSHLRI